jgi:hypothetical protein
LKSLSICPLYKNKHQLFLAELITDKYEKKKYWATRVIMITKQDNNSKYKKLQADITNSNSLFTEKNGSYFKTKCLGKYLVPRQKNQKNYENCKRKSFTPLHNHLYSDSVKEVERVDARRTHRGKLNAKFWMESFTEKAT